jgi:hypothetical protein
LRYSDSCDLLRPEGLFTNTAILARVAIGFYCPGNSSDSISSPLCATKCETNSLHFGKADYMLSAPVRSCLPVSLISTVYFLLCSGCASHSNAPLPRQSVQIVSEPPGARIEINGRYVGDAPTTVEIESSPSGRFWKDTIIKAYPKNTGYIQIKAFNGESRWSISDPIPGRISFDTRTEPAAGLNETLGR